MKEGFYNKTPLVLDSIDGETQPKKEGPLVLESSDSETTPGEKIETLANGNPVQTERARESLGDRGERMLGVAMEKADALGKKTGEFMGAAIEKGGASWAWIRQRWDAGVASVEQNRLNSVEEVKAAEQTLAGDTSEAVTATATANEEVAGLGRNYTLERVAGTRSAIQGAVEKNVKVGSENFSLMKWATESIKRFFVKALLVLKLKALEKMEGDAAKNLARITGEKMKVADSLRAHESEKSEHVAEAIPFTTATERQSPESLESTSDAPAAAPEMATNENAPSESPEAAPEKIPELRDEGIEAAFARGAGKTPELRDEGIEAAFAAGSRAAANDGEQPDANDFEKAA